MTHDALGKQLRQLYPHLNQEPGDDKALALRFLNLYPQYYDLISPVSRRIKEISERLPTSNRFTEKGRLESIEQQVFINRQEAQSLLYMDTALRAAEVGVSVETYERMKEHEHSLHLQKDLLTHQYELEKKKDNDALDVGNRELLTPHELVDTLEAKLMTLVDRFDAESHPKKKRILSIRIKRLMEELDGRAQTTALQASYGTGLERSNAVSDEQRSVREKAPEDLEQVSVKGFGASE